MKYKKGRPPWLARKPVSVTLTAISRDRLNNLMTRTGLTRSRVLDALLRIEAPESLAAKVLAIDQDDKRGAEIFRRA